MDPFVDHFTFSCFAKNLGDFAEEKWISINWDFFERNLQSSR